MQDVSWVTFDHMKPYAWSVSGTKPAGVSSLMLSLVLNETIDTRVYFTLDDVNKHTFTLEGQPVIPKPLGTYYVVENPYIEATEFANYATITVDGIYNVKVSAMSYCYNALRAYDGNKAKTDLCNLARSIYIYNQAALAYFA